MTPSALRLACLAHVLMTPPGRGVVGALLLEEQPMKRADRIYAWASAAGAERGKERLHCWQIAEARHGAHDRRPIEDIANEFWSWANPEGKAAAADFETAPAASAGESAPETTPADKDDRQHKKRWRLGSPAARA